MAEVDLTNKKGYLAEAVTQRCFVKQRSEIFNKTHRKTSVQKSYLACRRETLIKKRLPHSCFLIKFIRAAFHRTPVKSLTTLTIIFNFVKECLKIWCMKQSENVFRAYCLGKLLS